MIPRVFGKHLSSGLPSASSSRPSLESRYKLLFNTTLPQIAKQKKWPVYLNHCLMRIALDNYCGKCWYDRWEQKKGAMKSMSDEELKGVLAIAERMKTDGGEGDGGWVGDMNRKSLAWRGKQGPKRGK
jgi:hypothetical protein